MQRDLGMDEGFWQESRESHGGAGTAPYGASQAPRIVHMGSAPRDGQASGEERGGTHRDTPRPEGVAVWAEDAERGKAADRGKARSLWALPVTQGPAWAPRRISRGEVGEQRPETKCPTGVEPGAVQVVCTVLNGEGGETGCGTALCPYPTPTPYSLRSFLASAFGRGSPLALDGNDKTTSRYIEDVAGCRRSTWKPLFPAIWQPIRAGISSLLRINRSPMSGGVRRAQGAWLRPRPG
jgi:hypothetical protein